jgi:cytochrome P450
MSRSIQDLPTPKGLPVLGHALQFTKPLQMHLKLEEWAETLGPIYRVDFGPMVSMVVLCDAADINQLLLNRPDTFQRSRRLRSLLEELYQEPTGVFMAEGDVWHRQRKLVMSVFNRNNLGRYYDLIHRSGERLHRRFHRAAQSGQVIDMGHEFNLYASDVAASLALGQDLNALERGSNEFRELYLESLDRVVARMVMPVPYWRYVKLPADRRAERATTKILEALWDFMAQGRERIKARPELLEHPESLLDALFAEQAINGEITDEDILGNMSTLMSAGQDSTANTLTWAVAELAGVPRVQEALAAEARDVLGDAAFPPDQASIDRLPYAQAVLREAIRLRSAGPVTIANAMVDTELAGTHLPAGTEIAMLTRFAARDRQPDEAEFRPERWLDDGPTPPKTMAFGNGPRFCPGRNLAFLEATSALAMIGRDFEITLDPNAPKIVEELHFAMSPNQVHVILRPRVREAVGV